MAGRSWMPIDGAPENVRSLTADFGGKFFGLARLASEGGYPIPPGVGISWQSVKKCESSPKQFAHLLDRELLPHLQRVREDHGGRAQYPRLSIRSSANVEDGADVGFPGVFGTVLDVGPEPAAVTRAIQEVLDSAVAASAVDYCASQGIDHTQVRMACLVQWQVESQLSGVAMTSSNNRVCDQYLLLNFAEGACRNVVDGRSTNEIVFTKDTPVIVSANCRDFDDLIWDCRRSYEHFAESQRARNWNLDTLAEVAGLCVGVEAAFGRPMDVEWTVDLDGKIFVLQARPIVHGQAIAPMAGM